MSKKLPAKITGYIKRHPDGFGFLIPDSMDFPDVYLPKKEMFGVMSNDLIEVSVKPEPGGERFRGKFIKVIDRGISKAMGRLHRMSDKKAVLQDMSHAWGEDLIVHLEADDQFEDGDWVQVEIVSYPDSKNGLTGKIIQVVGDSVLPNNDNLRVLLSHSVIVDFSKEALKECDGLPDEVTEEDCQNRKDLTNLNFITIDGVTAKDFDDAVYVETTKRGFRLLVAIADVSHYVKPDSPLDIDAYKKGNSTYLPNFVAPMLPEKLSNGLCSLRPNVKRLSVVADMQLSFQGEILESEFYEAVIESKSRVTYGEAQEVIDGNTPEKHAHVEKNILQAADLAKILMAKRYKEGSLSLEISETEVEVDEAGQPVDIIRAERLFSHKLIEEMMLIANVAVARFLISKNVASLFRVHDSPDLEKVKVLEKFIYMFGVEKNISGGKLQKKITKALQSFKGKPQEQILNILALRSMSQATYQSDNVGHFGLGFDDYVHFTSPIRRYPDLIIHRLIKSVVCPQKGYVKMNEGELDSAGTHLSACEQRSVKAERQLIGIKKARFIENYMGQEFEGIVSSVTRFGLFVLLRRFDVDGLVRVEELPGDYFVFDEENLCLKGKKSGKQYNIGDPLDVIVAAVDTDEGKIDFLISGSEEAYVPPTPRSEPLKTKKKGKRRGADKGKKKTKSSSQRLSLKTNRRGLRKARVSKSRRKSKTR